MRFIPTRIHGAIDYLWGAALIAAPFLLGFTHVEAARWTAFLFGAGAIGYSLVTDYEWGVVRLVPVPLHLAFDLVAGAILALSPWLLGFSRDVAWPHVVFGLFAVAAGLVTRTRPAPPA